MILTAMTAPLALGALVMKKKIACTAMVGAAAFGAGVLVTAAAMSAMKHRNGGSRYHPHPSAAEPDAADDA
ncbi:MAG: hypothetical protein AAGK00_19385 [Pseudomonadota bacterium]